MHTKALAYVRDLTWPEVFEFWRQNEEHRSNWKIIWQERKFASWAQWRMTYADAFDLPQRTWKLFRVESPKKTVPLFCGGPFRGWMERFYDGETLPIFQEIVKHPEIRSHTGIQDIKEHFPTPTTISAVQNDDGIVVIEGMHRCAAIALAAEEEKEIAMELFLALADYIPGRLPLVGKRD